MTTPIRCFLLCTTVLLSHCYACVVVVHVVSTVRIVDAAVNAPVAGAVKVAVIDPAPIRAHDAQPLADAHVSLPALCEQQTLHPSVDIIAQAWQVHKKITELLI